MNDQVELIPGVNDAASGASSAHDVESEEVAAEMEWRDQYFWVAVYPGFETMLFLAPDSLPSDSLAEYSSMDCAAELTFFDCDGGVANEVSLAFPGSRATAIQLGQFMSPVKLHCGWKSALLKVRAPTVVKPYCRLQAASKAAFLGTPDEVFDGRGAFFPVTIAGDRKTLLAVMNPLQGDEREEVSVKCRFYIGSRTPDVQVTVPVGGFRILGIESEFSEYCAMEAASEDGGSSFGSAQGYLRLSSKGRCLVQTLEIIELDEQTRILSSVG
jgi:hypothetical protein